MSSRQVPDTTARTVPAYEALAADIKGLGVECVFGLMSDDTALLVASIDSMGVRFHGARHENNAIAMAEGYAAATGRLGVVVIGRGPATANGLHGATYAQRTGSPVLLIVGDASNAAAAPNGLGPDTKGFNTAVVLHGAGIRTFTANDAATARRTLAQAAAAALHGAVALLLPANVQLGAVDLDASAPGFVPVAAKPPLAPLAPRRAALQAAAAVLAHSRRPLLVAGAGAHRAGARDALVRLADHLGAALATTMKAKDLFRGHAFDCGVVGSFSHAGGRRLIDQADAVIVFGAGLNQRTTSYGLSLPPDVPLIQVDTDRSHIGRWFHCDIALVGDARLAAEQLVDAVPARADADKPLRSEALRRWLAEFDLASDFVARHTPRTMDARSVGLELDRLLPADRNLVYDAGNFLAVAPYISVPDPSRIKQASDFSSIGMGFGVALGYARGTPERSTVLILGDGSFLMTMGELETVVREDIPLVIVLMNDCAYGAELHFLQVRDMPTALSQFPDIDYAPIAAAFGFQAATVRTIDELRALAPMLAKPDGPVFLDCKINAAVAAPFLAEGLAHERRKG